MLPRPKKLFGQHFLTDRGVLGRIVESVTPTADDWLMEIGPGRGAMTRLLLASGAHLVAVEIDRQLVPLLRQEFAEEPRFEVVEGDVLDIDLERLLLDRHPGPWKMAANLPYNISTPLLFRFIDLRQHFTTFVVMLQREVGDRLTASPGSKEYGALTLLFQLYFDVTREFIVRPGAFHPPPKVDSVVLRFTPLPAPRLPVNEMAFRKVVKGSFAHRRKTLWNNLRGGTFGGDEELRQALLSAGIDPTRRAETLNLDDFGRLTSELASLITVS
jgi:16S rRNA (adenine1518-N6/adenine1519-N6)-dimethyltransferase